MAKKYVDADKFMKGMDKLGSYINNKQVNLRLARKAQEIIYRRVKSGYGVNSDKTDADDTVRAKLKPLSKSYIAFRRGEIVFFTNDHGVVFPSFAKPKEFRQKQNGKWYTFNKINKRTGKLVLEKLKPPVLGEFGRPSKSNATFTGQMLSSIRLVVKEDQFGLQIPRNRRVGDGLTNAQVNEYYSKERPWFNLTAGELRILTRELEKIIDEIIKREFT